MPSVSESVAGGIGVGLAGAARAITSTTPSRRTPRTPRRSPPGRRREHPLLRPAFDHGQRWRRRHRRGAGGTGVAAVSLGVGFAINSITDTVKAFVDSSSVTAAESVTIEPLSTGQIGGLTIGGAVSAGGGAGLGLVLPAPAQRRSTTLRTISKHISTASRRT